MASMEPDPYVNPENWPAAGNSVSTTEHLSQAERWKHNRCPWNGIGRCVLERGHDGPHHLELSALDEAYLANQGGV